MEFRVGTVVKVSRTVTFGYDADSNRIPFIHPVKEEDYYLIGIRHQPLGKYCGGHNYSTLDGMEYDPAYLKVKGTVKVALMVRSLKNEPVMVLWEDVEVSFNESK